MAEEHKKEHHKKEDHLKEIKEEHQRVEQELAEKKKIEINLPDFNLWMFTTGILAIILIAYVFMGPKASAGIANELSPADAGNAVIKYLNENLVSAGTTAKLVKVNEVAGVYEIITEYQGSNVSVYASKDGVMLFLSTMNTTEKVASASPEQTTIPKTAKPVVDLYVMAFCPYGVQAEQIMKPVADLLGSAATINVRFIASVGGNTTESVSSLHGLYEAKEDLRQVCIMKYYPAKYWSYVYQIDNNCYANARNETFLESCWKNASTTNGINATKIETCAYGAEGLGLLKADEALTQQFGVSGSPTLLINNVTYSGSRTSDAFKQAICGAFTAAPAACNQTVAESAATASGSC